MSELSRRTWLGLAGAMAAVGPAAAVPDRFDLVIKGGEVIDPSQSLWAKRDVGIRFGSVAALEPDIPAERAKQTIDAWDAEIAKGLDAILVTASGCGTTIKDYGFMFRDDPAYAEKARRVSALAKDVTEYVAQLDLKTTTDASDLVVAYHSAC
ncbi:hypothetical protein CJ027_021355, partial [Xanthomonas sontii]|nr:hypothetical protein [Xanthomonas sontii]